MTYGQAKKIKEMMHKAAKSLGDEDALSAPELFPSFKIGETYNLGDRFRYNNVLYKVCQPTIVSTSNIIPGEVGTEAIYAKVLYNGVTVAEWEQPNSTNPYMKDDKVLHGGKTWICLIDNNVWEPGVYGWKVMD